MKHKHINILCNLWISICQKWLTGSQTASYESEVSAKERKAKYIGKVLKGIVVGTASSCPYPCKQFQVTLKQGDTRDDK